jgi:hypothetical protein
MKEELKITKNIRESKEKREKGKSPWKNQHDNLIKECVEEWNRRIKNDL